MALMSELLLCAVLTRLLLALGDPGAADQKHKFSSPISNKHNTQISSDLYNKALSIYTSRKLKDITEPLFSNNYCKKCRGCVEKAFNLLKNYTDHFEKMNPQVKAYSYQHRNKNKKFKRSVDNFNNTELVEDGKLKSVRVTKYKTAEDKVYAIKVNEINNQVTVSNDGTSTCKVYSVKKAFPCESEESNLILLKRKVNKKRVPKQKNTTTEKSRRPTSVFKNRKLRVENPNVPESFMPSIEELY